MATIVTINDETYSFTFKGNGCITIGIGYKIKTREVIFTANGYKIFCLPIIDNRNGKLNETDLMAIILLRKINEIKINVGKSPFVYNLLQEYPGNTEIINCYDESNQLNTFVNTNWEDYLRRLNYMINQNNNY